MMARYSYVAYDTAGMRITGEIPAASRSSALDALSRKGCYPASLVEASSSQVHWTQREVFGARQLPVGHLALFTRELASLLRASIPVDESLRLIAVQPLLPRKVHTIVHDLQSRVGEGQSLSSSMAAQAPAFPEYYWRLIEAGEAAGTVDTALEDLAIFLETSSEMRGRVVSALLYPAILFVAAVIAIGVVMSVLLPALGPIFEDARVPPPMIIAVFASVDAFIRANWIGLFLMSAVAGVGLGWAIASPRLRWRLDRALLALPILGSAIERRETGRFARTMATLIKGGVPLVEATHVAGAIVTNKAIARSIEHASQHIREGGTLSTPLAQAGMFSELFLRLVSIGESTGQLEAMLFRAADIYESVLARQLQRLIGLITPITTIIIGGVVGVLILSVMSALMSINDLALQ